MHFRLLVFAVIMGIVITIITPFVKQHFFNNDQSPIDPNHISSKIDKDVKTGEFHGNKVGVPSVSMFDSQLANDTEDIDILGKKSSSKKNERVIKISLKEQKLFMYEGSKMKKSFKISSGLWGWTPTGEFKIWTKLTSTLMTGGSKALGTYYYLPNVPYTMYFYNSSIPKSRGYGIHGAYWHNNFGQPMSHGCINMKPDEAKILFDWASAEKGSDSGTKIVIY
jgi:hypothetical protein